MVATRVLSLEEPVERPDLAGTQTLKAHAHSGWLLRSALLDPAYFAADVDGLGLGRDAKANLQPRLQRENLVSLDEHAAEGNVSCGGGALLLARRYLDVQPAFVAGICATEMV